MACKFTVNGQESQLYNTILEAYNGNEELATALHSYFKNDFEFIKNFGNWEQDFKTGYDMSDTDYNYNQSTSRIEDNGEPKLFKDNNGNYYYIDKDKLKVYVIENKNTLKSLFENSEITQITKVLTNNYFKNNLNLDFENINLDNVNSTLRQSVINKLNERISFLNNSEDILYEDIADRLQEALNNNLDEIVNNVKSYLEQFKIVNRESYNENLEDTDLENIEIAENEKDPGFGISSNERSTKDNISANIKLRLSLIEDIEAKDYFLNDTIYKSFDDIYSDLLPILTNKIALNIDNEQEDIFEILKSEILKLVPKKPYFEELYRILSKDGLSNNIKSEFFQAFNLDTNRYNTSKITRTAVLQQDGSVVDANDVKKFDINYSNINVASVGNKETQVFNEWNLNFKNKFVTTNETSKNEEITKENIEVLKGILSDVNKIKYNNESSIQNIINSLRDLGIETTTQGFNHYLDNLELINNDNEVNEKIFNSTLTSLKFFLNNVIKGNNKNFLNILSSESVFKNIAKGEAFYISEGSDASIYTAGKQKWIYSYPSYLSNTIKSWKKDRNILFNHYKLSKFNEGSDWMKYLLALDNTYQVDEFLPQPVQEQNRIDESRRRINEIDLASFNVIQDEDNSSEGMDNKTIDKATYISDTINKVLSFNKANERAYYRTTTPADKGTQYELHVGRNISTNARYGDNGGIVINDEAVDIIFNYFNAEYKRMKFEREFMDNPNNVDKLRTYYHLGAGHAFKSQLFPDLSFDKIRKVSEGLGKNFHLIYEDNNAYLSDLKNSEFEADLKEYIASEIANKIDSTLGQLTNQGVFTFENGTYENVALDSKIWNSYKSDNALKATADFYINSLMSHVEYSKMFAGDIAYFKNGVDYKKRVPATYTDGLYQRLDNNNKEYNVATIESINIASPFLPELNELLGEEIGDKYSNINSADAQAWITPDRWKDIWTSLGKWNEVYKSAYEKLLGDNSEPFTLEELKKVAPPVKGVYFQLVNGVPTFLKYSQAVLSPRLRTGNELEKIYNAMVKQNIDELVTFDAIKVGSNLPTKIHDKNGNIIDDFTLNPFTIPSNGWKLQQDLPVKGFHDTEVGSQIQKNILQGLSFNLDNMFQLDNQDISGNDMIEKISNVIGELSDRGYDSVLNEFGIGDDFKITNISGFYNALISELKTRGGSENIVRALEAETSIYGLPQMRGKLESIFSSIMNKRILKIKTNGGSFIQMSNFGLNKNNAEAQGVIWSPNALQTTHEPQFLKDDEGKFILSKNGKKIVRPGGVLISGSFIAKYIPNYATYTHEQLFGSTKKIDVSEIYSKLGNKTVSDNIIIKSLYQNAGVEYAKENNSIFSLRVNNSNKHFGNPFSSVQSEIAKGLIATKSTRESVEKYMDWVINSQDERANWIREQIKSGNLDNKNIIYYKELGEPSHATALDYLIKNKELLNNNGEFVKGIIDDKILNNIIGYRIPNQGLSSNDALQIVGILPEENGDTVVAYTGITTKTGSDYDIDKMYIMFPSYNFENDKLVYENYNTELPESEQTKEALQNRLIELYKSVLLNENTIGDVMTPIDFDHMKNDIRSLHKEKPITNLSLFDPLGDIDVKYSFLAGKAGVGQEANALMDYVLGSISDLSISNFTIKKGNKNLDEEYSQELSKEDWQYYQKELKLSDSEIEGLKKIKISHSISAILNAFVDIAKDPYITEGNWVTMTTNTGNLLLRKGVHPFYVNAFLSQPILKEYVDFAAQYEQSDTQTLNTTDAFIEEKFGSENYKEQSKTDVLENPLKHLRLQVNNWKNSKMNQIDTFYTFLKYQSASKAIKNNIDASKFMVNGVNGSVTNLNIGKNLVDSILDNEQRYNDWLDTEEDDTSFNKNIILGFQSKFRNPNGSESMFSRYYNNIILGTSKIISANPILFLSGNTTVQNTFNEISHSIKNEILVDNDLGNQLEKDHYSYIMSGFNPLQTTVDEKRDLIRNFAKEFETFKEDNLGLYKIIDELNINVGNTFDFVGLNNKKKSQEYENNVINSFVDLLDNESEFADKLIKYSFLTSGFNMNMSQFFTMIPSQWFIRNNINRYIFDTSKNLDSFGEYNDDEFIDQFFLSNLEGKLIRGIQQSQIEKNNLNTTNGFEIKKEGKAPYFIKKIDSLGINPPIYYKLLGYNSNLKGIYSRFIQNSKGEYVDVQNLNIKDKKGNRIINFNTDGINLKISPTGQKLLDVSLVKKLNSEVIYPRDHFYRNQSLIRTNNTEDTQSIVDMNNTPVFNTLPNKSDIPTMTYAGIGSRETPENIQKEMTELAKMLEEKGYTLRSGGAKGADTAFENGTKVKQIFLGSKKTGEKELQIAREIHPNAKALDNSKNPGFVWNLMARNTNQIFGEDLNTPVDFVIAWTQDALDETKKRSLKSGGTGQAIDMASRKNIPIINLANPNWRNKLNSILDGTFKSSGEQLSLFGATEEELKVIEWQKQNCK